MDGHVRGAMEGIKLTPGGLAVMEEQEMRMKPNDNATASATTTAVSSAVTLLEVTLLEKSDDASHGQRVSVVISTVGEEPDVTAVLERMPAIVDEIVFVNGASAAANRDEAGALRAAFGAARGDYVVMVDPDAGSDAGEIERFVDALRTGVRS